MTTVPRQNRRHSAALLVLGLAPAAACADVIEVDGMAPYESCGYCHGLDGNSGRAGFPRLGGQQAAYLRKQLEDFRAGRRGDQHHPMRTAARALSEPELDEVVRHFAAQMPPAADTLPELYRSGRKGLAPCAGCHGEHGEGRAAVPRLAGQQPEYLRAQLLAFRRGERRNDGGVMGAVARALREDEIALLAAALGARP